MIGFVLVAARHVVIPGVWKDGENIEASRTYAKGERLAEVIFSTEAEAWDIASAAFAQDAKSRLGLRAWLDVCKVHVTESKLTITHRSIKEI